MPPHLSAARTDVDGLGALAPLWAELHQHHLEVSAYPALVADTELSSVRRLDWYRRLLADGASYLTATDDEGRLIGYAVVAFESGPDDTFAVEGGSPRSSRSLSREIGDPPGWVGRFYAPPRASPVTVGSTRSRSP